MMTSIRRQLVDLVERGAIPPEQVATAARLSGLYPSGQAWYEFVDRLLLWLGSLALAFGVLFLIAWNWAGMGRLPRFGLVEAALVLTIAVYWVAGGRGVVARVALTAAVLLVGVLLALVGQVYHSGADPWQLFFTWALLVLPWVLVARFDVLWVLWLGLLDLAVLRFFHEFRPSAGIWWIGDVPAQWGLLLLNGLALALWELAARRWQWLSARWPRCLLALGSGGPITLLMMMFIIDEGAASWWSPVVYLLWLVGLYATYRYWRPDLFMLAGGCLSLMLVVTLFVARLLWNDADADAGGLLLLALLVLAQGAAAVFWLKRLHREMTS